MKLSKGVREEMVRRYVKKRKDFWSVTQGIYTVHSMVSASKALEYAIFMQDFAARADKVFEVRPKGTFRPVIYHFKDPKTMMQTIKEHTATIELDGDIPEWAGGVYLANFQRLYVYEHESTREIMLHEGTHQFLNYLFGSGYRRLPIWVDEGLATNLETWDLNESRAVSIEMNRQRSERRFVVRNIFGMKKPPITLGQLFEKDREGWLSAQGEAAMCQYGVAWSFVDYCLNTADGKAFLKQVCTRAYGGKKSTKIPKKLVELYEKKWRQYVKEKVLPGIPENGNVEVR
ncbi:DUF1570 domain-containing protein [Planctomycetota bacterium]